VQKLKAVGRGRQSTQVYVTVAVAEVAALSSYMTRILPCPAAARQSAFV